MDKILVIQLNRYRYKIEFGYLAESQTKRRIPDTTMEPRQVGEYINQEPDITIEIIYSGPKIEQ